jgi:hypothetical protein
MSDIDVGTRCKNLLEQYETVYIEYLNKEKEYHHNLRQWHSQIESEIQEEDKKIAIKKKFNDSQFVEWNGEIYNCANFTTSDPITRAQSEKCKCQQLYGQRRHLSSIPSMTGILSREQCEEKGYLNNHNIEEKLCPRHIEENQLVYHCNCPATVEPGLGKVEKLLEKEPSPPLLFLPTITCNPCKKEFENLATDFSYENIAKINSCINKLKKPMSNHIAGAPPPPPLLSPLPPLPPPPPPQPQPSPSPSPSPSPPVAMVPVHQVVANVPEVPEVLETTNKSSPNIFIIIFAIVLFIFSIYLVYCISRNVPYDLVCSKVAMAKHAEDQNQIRVSL